MWKGLQVKTFSSEDFINSVKRKEPSPRLIHPLFYIKNTKPGEFPTQKNAVRAEAEHGGTLCTAPLGTYQSRMNTASTSEAYAFSKYHNQMYLQASALHPFSPELEFASCFSRSCANTWPRVALSTFHCWFSWALVVAAHWAKNMTTDQRGGLRWFSTCLIIQKAGNDSGFPA